MVGDHSRLVYCLIEHPRLIGALLTVLLALSQLGTVAANHASTVG